MFSKKLVTPLLFSVLTLVPSISADVPFGDILHAFPKLGDFTAQSNCYHPEKDDVFAKIGDRKFELRYVTFIGTTSDSLNALSNSFHLKDLKSIEAKPNPHQTVYYFMQPQSVTQNDIYFTVTYREVTDETSTAAE